MEYLIPSEFGSVCGPEPSKCLKIFHVNTQSAKNKITQLETLFNQFQFPFDIVMFTETWYVDDVNVFQLPLYNTFCQNRTTSRGGGVSLMIRKDFECEQLKNYSCVTPDYEILSVLVNGTFVSVVYRPPSGIQ